MVCRDRSANSPARGAYPRIRARLLTYWHVSGQPVPPGGTPGSARPAPPRGGAFAPTVRVGCGPSDGSEPVPAKGLTPTPPASYPRIRAALLTYWPGPGGRFAGTEARIPRQGDGGLSADKGSTADLLAHHQPTRPARQNAGPRLLGSARSVLKRSPGPFPRRASPHGGRFASSGPGAALRTVRTSVPGRGQTLSADKAKTFAYWHVSGQPVPPGRKTGQRPPRSMAGASLPPGRTLPFGRFAHLFRDGGGPYPRIRAALLTYWHVSGQPVPPGRKIGPRRLGAPPVRS